MDEGFNDENDLKEFVQSSAPPEWVAPPQQILSKGFIMVFGTATGNVPVVQEPITSGANTLTRVMAPEPVRP
jgi:hypothetical protein